MPTRNPNQLLGSRREDRNADDNLVYIDSDATSTCSTSREDDRKDQYMLAMAKREIKRLNEAIKSLETCIRNRKPDTSAAWQLQAEQAKSELSTLKKDYDELLKELSAVKDALSQQILSGKDEIEEAVRRERDEWKEQIAAANQEIEDVRSELQQTLQRYEEAEMNKTSAMFELTQERNKVHPRGVDHESHQGVLQELIITRTRLKQQEALLSETEQRSKAEAAASQAELQQNSAYLKRVVKEMKSELSQANDAAAESDAQLTRLSTEHKKLTAQAEALKAENSKLVQAQSRWQDWFDEMQRNLRAEAKKGWGVGDELTAIRQIFTFVQRLKVVEESAEAAVGEAMSRTLVLVNKAPSNAV